MSNALIWTAQDKERFAKRLQWILKWEGSTYSNHPLDAGGPTRYGVIASRYDQYRKAMGLPLRSVKFIEMDEVTAIYARYYWNVIDGDELPVPYDLALFNVAVNSGTGRAAQFRGEIEKAHPDADPLTRARAICDRYEIFYRAIVRNNPSQKIWLGGWMNRLNDCRAQIEEDAASLVSALTPAAWTLMLNSTALGPAIVNAADENRAYFPVRKLLYALLPDAEVDAKLVAGGTGMKWEGVPVSYPTFYVNDGTGKLTGYGQVRGMAASLGLDVLVDGKQRDITLVRSAAAAKTGGQN